MHSTQPTLTDPQLPSSVDEADPPSRRSVVTACAFAVLGAGGLAACGSSSSTTATPAGSSSAAGGGAQSALAKLADVPVNGAITATGPSGPIVIARKSETEVVAFNARCTHQGTQVAPNGKEYDCPAHGSRFDAFTGAVLNGPAAAPLASIPVKISGTDIVSA